MKKCVFALMMMASVTIASAQNDSIKGNNYGQNEIKVNSILLLAGAFEPIYERNLSESTSVGISLFIPFDDENFDTDLNYYISPYYRIFFGNKYAAGFFLEGFGMLNSMTNYSYVENNNFGMVKEENITDFAVGLGLGGKWLTRSGFVFEVNGGFGRNLFNTDNDYDDTPFVGKLGFNLGYRF